MYTTIISPTHLDIRLRFRRLLERPNVRVPSHEILGGPASTAELLQWECPETHACLKPYLTGR
jgi:hypothetical protein